MLTAVKNQIKINILSIKYATMREMLNKWSFLLNVLFMIINNATFIIQWIVLFSLKEDVGGYTFKQVLLLWGIAASTFGFSHFFFKRAYSLSDTITNGKLDSYLVQPKNVLLASITSDVEPSAIGDMIYGYIMLFVSGCTIAKFLLFTLFTICGGIIITAIAVIVASLSFWFTRSDTLADSINSMLTHFATYPDGIFKGVIRILFFTLIPVGIINYMPVWIISNFNLKYTMVILSVTIISIILAFSVFYKGIKKYSSSNLMISKI